MDRTRYILAPVIWLFAMGGTFVALYISYWLVIATTSRQSEGGLITSRLGRSARVLGSALTVGRRYWLRKLRRLFTSQAKRAEIDRRYQEETGKFALETMGNMKGVLMKLGQIVSFMDEALPEAYAAIPSQIAKPSFSHGLHNRCKGH